MAWHALPIPGFLPDGTPVISVVAGQDYTIARECCRPCEERGELHPGPVLENPEDPLYSELAHGQDLVACKSFTDLIVSGEACAPRGKQALHLDCEVTCGQLAKRVRVYGERTMVKRGVRGFRFSEPTPYSHQRLGYRFALGGCAQDAQGRSYAFPPNPIGRGFTLRHSTVNPVRIAVPLLEDPHAPLMPDHLLIGRYEEWHRLPPPASLGWTRPHFFPRSTYAGIPPGLRTSPSDPPVDFRFYQEAPPGLWGGPLIGGEMVRITYMDPDAPDFQFLLPDDRPLLTLDIGDGPTECEPILQTVHVAMDTKKLSLVWRASLPYDGPESLFDLPCLAAAARERT